MTSPGIQFSISAPELPLTGEERAYVELRLFSVLRPFADGVDQVRVVVTTRTRPGGSHTIACAVHARSAVGAIVARGSSDWLYGAVDKAANRLAFAAEDAFGRHRASSAHGPPQP